MVGQHFLQGMVISISTSIVHPYLHELVAGQTLSWVQTGTVYYGSFKISISAWTVHSCLQELVAHPAVLIADGDGVLWGPQDQHQNKCLGGEGHSLQHAVLLCRRAGSGLFPLRRAGGLLTYSACNTACKLLPRPASFVILLP